MMNAARTEQFALLLRGLEGSANRFVLQLLDHYTLFSVRMKPSEPNVVARPDVAEAPAECMTLVRPHERVPWRTDLDGSGRAAEIRQGGIARPTVKIELRRLDDNPPIDGETDLKDGRAMGLRKGDRGFVTLKKQPSFVEDYSI